MTTGTEGNDDLSNDPYVTHEVIEALGGDDTITVGMPDIQHYENPTVTVHGGDGYDTLILSGTVVAATTSGGITTFSFYFSSSQRWTVSYDGIEAVEYTGTMRGGGNTLATGNANDTLNIYSSSVVNVSSGGGNDRVIVSGTFELANISGGDGNDHLDISGGSYPFQVEPFRLSGDAGNDTLISVASGYTVMSGGTGNDSFVVMNAADTVVELSGEGDDTVTTHVEDHVLAANVENLVLAGTIVRGYGNAGANRLTGNDAANYLYGEGGDDSLDGGIGDDWLEGGDGHDALDGGAGLDTMRGGTGDDSYWLRDSGDTIVEAADEGTDKVFSAITGYALAAHLENLELIGAAATGSGNGANNIITGNDLGNELYGLDGHDEIDGAGGDDRLEGGAGDDLLRSGTHAAGLDQLLGGTGTDQLHALFTTSATGLVAAAYTANAGDGGLDGTLSTADGARTVSFTSMERFHIGGTAFADQIAGADLDDTLLGDAGDDVLNGHGGNDMLDGGTGNDSMTGGTGDDIYVVDSAGDSVIEGANGGSDTVRIALASYVLPQHVENLVVLDTAPASIDIRGNSSSNAIDGSSSNEFMRLQDGGDDTARGFGGHDVFYFGAAFDSADAVDGGEGTDQVALQGDYSGGLTFGAASLAGVEILALLSGFDARFGDTSAAPHSYVLTSHDANVAAGGKLIVDAAQLEAGENLTFDGSAELDGSLYIYAGKGVDHFTGGAQTDVFLFRSDGRFTGDDRVDGGGGRDQLALRGDYTGANAVVMQATSMTGIEVLAILSGNDSWWGSHVGDLNYDILMHDGNVTAGAFLIVDAAQLLMGETLLFDGSAETDGTYRVFGGLGVDTIIGGEGADMLNGRGGGDVLDGGLGNDQLTGGDGADAFLFASALDGVANVDAILDFSVPDDTIHLSRTIFTEVGPAGILAASAFRAGASAEDADDRIVYDAATGNIYYDADGSDAGAAILFATVDPGTPLTHADFFVYG